MFYFSASIILKTQKSKFSNNIIIYKISIQNIIYFINLISNQILRNLKSKSRYNDLEISNYRTLEFTFNKSMNNYDFNIKPLETISKSNYNKYRLF